MAGFGFGFAFGFGTPGRGVGWTPLAGAAIDMDFVSGRYLGRAPVDLTCVRNSVKFFQLKSGLWTNVSANLLGLGDLGLSVEELRTNVVLQNRDLSNAVWVKTGCTGVRDLLGITGAITASTLTATAAAATCLQTTVVASSPRWHSSFVKRLVGAGAVAMTMDGGATWVDVTAQVTAAWTRISIPSQTLANPQVGFRLATAGDAIGVEFVQNEGSGEMASSPISNGGVAITRQADVITMTVPPAFGAARSLYARGIPFAPLLSAAAEQMVLSVDDGTTVNQEAVGRAGVNGRLQALQSSGGVGATLGTRVVTTGAAHRIAAAFAANDLAASVDGQATESVASTLAAPAGTGVHIGCGFNGASSFNGLIERIAFWPTTRLSNAQLQAL